MNKFVPRGKMSKRRRKALDAKSRKTWDVLPVSRIVPNKKKLEQERKPRPGKIDAGWGDFPYIA